MRALGRTLLIGLLTWAPAAAQSNLDFINANPGGLGPNGVPLPPVGPARVGTELQLHLQGEVHQAPGDLTVNPYLQFWAPFVPGRAALNLVYRTPEYWRTSAAVRDARNADTTTGIGASDLYIGGYGQALRQEKHWLDFALEVMVKTTAGKALENARHTNAPGYYFNAHLGRRWGLGQETDTNLTLGVTLSGGFYAWQTRLNEQNDAPFFGARVDLSWKRLTTAVEFAGMSGWQNRADRPLVLRAHLNYRWKRVDALLRYQYAFQDFVRHGVRAGAVVWWDLEDVKTRRKARKQND